MTNIIKRDRMTSNGLMNWVLWSKMHFLSAWNCRTSSSAEMHTLEDILSHACNSTQNMTKAKKCSGTLYSSQQERKLHIVRLEAVVEVVKFCSSFKLLMLKNGGIKVVGILLWCNPPTLTLCLYSPPLPLTYCILQGF